MFHERMREEMVRLGLKPSDVAKRSGAEDSHGIRDALGGRKRLTAEMLVLLGAAGMDTGYIVTGERSDSAITADEKELISLFRAAPLMLKAAVIGALHGGGSIASHATKVSTKHAMQPGVTLSSTK